MFCCSVKGALVSKVNGELWELGQPLDADCELELLGFDTLEGRQVMTLFCICLVSHITFKMDLNILIYIFLPPITLS